jgi:hypothetical protein
MLQTRLYVIRGARRRCSLSITCRRMFRVDSSPWPLEKYYPAFSIGLVMDPSSSEVVNSLPRKHNDPSLGIAQPFTHLRLYNQFPVRRYQYCKAYLAKLCYQSPQSMLKFGTRCTVGPKHGEKTTVCITVIQKSACKSLLTNLDEGFKGIVDEVKRSKLTQFLVKPPWWPF